jgi:tripartite ATP-independent transporter DctM subunit
MDVFAFIGIIFFFFATRVPIAFAMLGGSVIYLIVFADIDTVLIPQKIEAGLDSFSLLAVPFFVLLGELMSQSELTYKLVKLATNLLGFVRSGLAQVNILASMLFSGVSGAAVADASALGSLFIPAMIEEGYDADFSAAVTAASSTIGPIVPPSILAVIYGSMGNVSIGRLFLAGAIPGLIMGLYMMIVTYLITKRGSHVSRKPFVLRDVLSSCKETVLILFVPVLIIGGIVWGVVTPTESGVIGVVYVLIIGTFIYRTLNSKKILKALLNTVYILGPLGLILGAAGVLGWILNVEQTGLKIHHMLSSVSSNPIFQMVLINLILVILGCFIESVALITILTPIFVPVVIQLGFDPVHFGIIMLLNLMIGLITPPVGLCMFITTSIANISVESFLRSVWPYYVAIIFAIITISFFDQSAMFLPNLLMPLK